MLRRPPISTLTYTLFPYTTRSPTPERPDQSRGADHEDERARFLLAKVLRGRRRDIERAVEVNVDHRFPVVRGHLVKDRIAQEAGIVDHRVDAAEAVERALDELLRAVGFGVAVGADSRLAARRTNRVARFLPR